jgi:hypothetical protein
VPDQLTARGRRASSGRWPDLRLRALAVAVLFATLAPAALAPAARAQDRVYWTEVGGSANGLSFAALDGSGGGSLVFSVPKSFAFDGLTVDTAGGRFYWSAESKIESIAFDGSGQRGFDSGGVLTSASRSLSIDPDGRRLIWGRESSSTPIEIARLDGSGGGPLTAPGMTIGFTTGAIFDPPSQRVYFNSPGFGSKSPLGFAAIDGSGAGTLPLENVQPEGGLAIDHATGRVYWFAKGGIRSADLDGSDPGAVPTGLATIAEPQGMAIDEATGTIYWGNRKAHALSFARLDGSGAGQLNIAGALPGNPIDLVLLVAPRNLAVPVISGTAAAGAAVTCSAGAWAPDHPEAALFDAATSLAYRWTRDGAPLAGATGETLTVPAAGSSYGCAVTATNVAGSTTATSAPLAVPAPPAPRPPGFGAATAVTAALARGPVRRGVVKVTVENFNPFAVGGELTASPTAKSLPRGAKIAPGSFAVGPGTTASATLRLPGALRKLLEANGKLKLKLTATVVDPLGTRREVATVALATANHAKPPKPEPNKHRAPGAA